MSRRSSGSSRKPIPPSQIPCRGHGTTPDCRQSSPLLRRAVGPRARSQRAALEAEVRALARLRVVSLDALPSLVKPVVADPTAAPRPEAEGRARVRVQLAIGSPKVSGAQAGDRQGLVLTRAMGRRRRPDKAPLDTSHRMARISTRQTARIFSGMALRGRPVGMAKGLRLATTRIRLDTNTQGHSRRLVAMPGIRVLQGQVLAHLMVRRIDHPLLKERMIRLRRRRSRPGLRGGGLSVDVAPIGVLV